MSSLKHSSDSPRRGDLFWRTLQEWRQATASPTAEFAESDRSASAGELSRRQFARLMAASLALAGTTLTGCRRWPEQLIRPQSERSEGFLPGVADNYATQFELHGVATGILAKSVDGRPIKIEGNEQHPFSNGAADAFAQASILELYDPDRTRGYIYRPVNAPPAAGSSSDHPAGATQYSRQTFAAALTTQLQSLQAQKGRGLHVLAQSSSSPTLRRLRRQFLETYPESRWHVYQPLDRDNEFAGSRRAFNQVVRPQYQLQKAKTIVSFGADLLGLHPAHQKWSRDWARTRDPKATTYSRLWCFESGYSLTGAMADIRQPIPPSQMQTLVAAIAQRLGLESRPVALDAHLQNRVDQLVAELRESSAASLCVAGPEQSEWVHALTHAINHHLGSVGSTVSYTEEPLAENRTNVESMADLVGALRGKSVNTLLILGGNPAYDGPADWNLNLRDHSGLTSVYLGLFDNETAQQCTWHAPAAHFLEAWHDGRAWDGTYGVGQPLIYPLFDGISEIELLTLAMGKPVENGMDLVRETARSEFNIGDDLQWNRLLHDGVLAGSQFPGVDVTPASFPTDWKELPQVAEFEVCFVPDASTYDGRFANNGWLQELPDPLTKLTWDNAAAISAADAERLGLRDGDEIRIDIVDGDGFVEIPVLIQPGQAIGTLSLPLGYGRETGSIAKGVGTNVFGIRNSNVRHFVAGAQVRPTGRTHQLACTQEHYLIDAVGMRGRQVRLGERAQPGTLVRETTLRQHRRDPRQVNAHFHVPPAAPLFDRPQSYCAPNAWGMSIDLNTCVGCNACVVACQAENNIPIVGKVNVRHNREMHWLRIDRYFKGGVESPDVVFVPVACAHCEDAPCEQVCPVAATVHDTEGLNAMVYNRCVGTRYCANNCPYKVRRFNYFDYHASNPRAPAKPWLSIPDQQQKRALTDLEQMALNPEVSVRMRGVMEKCTYCVQRISAARIQARVAHAQGQRASADLVDGEVVTACQQACPTSAIRFGDLNNPQAEVAQAHRDDRAYAMLEETNIKPRTRYLAKIRNCEPESNASQEVKLGHG